MILVLMVVSLESLRLDSLSPCSRLVVAEERRRPGTVIVTQGVIESLLSRVGQG